ncbi:MAG TPA: metallophosphoesterase [Candidatus Angelobacter sp.]|nr:metallophosphoesterase [Candidatus Angelobacter sp.]
MAGWFAFRRLRKWKPGSRWVARLEFVLYLLVSIGTLSIIYAHTIEPYWPEVTHVSLRSRKLNPGRRLRIVQISDLHCDGKVRLEKRLPEIIRAEHPDLILFTGDTVNGVEGVPVARELLAQLPKIAPTYAVLGNWDVGFVRKWRQPLEQPSFFEGTGIHNLAGQAESVETAGIRIWIAGAATSQERLLPALLATAPPDQFSVLLFHFPDEVEVVQQKKIDLYLAGHTHGGQIALPFYGALVTFSKFDKKYERGLHAIGGSWLYVNRGIGLEGFPPRARFLSRPEITVFDISAQSQQQ